MHHQLNRTSLPLPDPSGGPTRKRLFLHFMIIQLHDASSYQTEYNALHSVWTQHYLAF